MIDAKRGDHFPQADFRVLIRTVPILDYFRIAHNAELTQRQGQAYSQRSESPRFREESLHLGMRAAVDQVL